MHAPRRVRKDATFRLPRRRVNLHPQWLVPEWGATSVGALMTTRAGGFSAAPFDSMNLRDGLGDDPAAVGCNKALLAAAIGAAPVELNQVHGCRVVRLAGDAAHRAAERLDADASVTTQRGLACTVQVADCLPVLFAAPAGRGVAAAHAGWRGLAAGVLEATLQSLCAAALCRAEDVTCWLGPCIGPQFFEVGPDVLAAFAADTQGRVPSGFESLRPGKWLADLPLLAKQRLLAAGIRSVHGGEWCTYARPARFFSFRRDGLTGRMAASVWLV